jgi:hypothetical protein
MADMNDSRTLMDVYRDSAARVKEYLEKGVMPALPEAAAAVPSKKKPKSPTVANTKETPQTLYKQADDSNNCCGEYNPSAYYVCTREKGHAGQHEAHTGGGMAVVPAWGDVETYPQEKTPSLRCNSYYQTWTCTRTKGHEGPHQAHYWQGKLCEVEPWNDAMATK